MKIICKKKERNREREKAVRLPVKKKQTSMISKHGHISDAKQVFEPPGWPVLGLKGLRRICQAEFLFPSLESGPFQLGP